MTACCCPVTLHGYNSVLRSYRFVLQDLGRPLARLAKALWIRRVMFKPVPMPNVLDLGPCEASATSPETTKQADNRRLFKAVGLPFSVGFIPVRHQLSKLLMPLVRKIGIPRLLSIDYNQSGGPARQQDHSVHYFRAFC